MKKLLLMLTLGVVLAGCNNANPLRRYDDAWWATKDSCASGNYNACSEIGHQAHPQPAPPTYTISEPIVD